MRLWLEIEIQRRLRFKGDWDPKEIERHVFGSQSPIISGSFAENHVIGNWDSKEIEKDVFESQSPIIGGSVAENQLQFKDPYN